MVHMAMGSSQTHYELCLGYFIQGELEKAVSDYKRAIEIDATRAVAFIQLGVAQYRMGEHRSAEATFRRATRNFPKSAHVRIFHSELLIDQQRFPEAEKELLEAAELDPTNALTWVNRALLSMQHRSDPQAAEAMLKVAIEVDSECEAAIVSLAQLYLQQGNLHEALRLFERGVELARTEQEISTMVGYSEATRTQISFIQQHPQLADRLRALQAAS
jgi:import receptor subunit TOM70